MASGLNRIAASLGRLPYNANLLAQETQTVNQHGVGVLSGLALTAGTGLALSVSSGIAQGPIAASVPGFSANVPDAATNYAWLDFSQPDVTASGYDVSENPVYAGSLTFTSTYAQPGGNLACLGRVTAAAGAITLVETVGRMQLQRWTGLQTYAIGDSVKIDTGLGVLTAAGGFGATSKTVAGSSITLTASEAAADVLLLSGTPGASRNVVVPSVLGKSYKVVNGTDSTITVKTPSGTGVAITTGKAAIVVCDGTNVVRLTPDA